MDSGTQLVEYCDYPAHPAPCDPSIQFSPELSGDPALPEEDQDVYSTEMNDKESGRLAAALEKLAGSISGWKPTGEQSRIDNELRWHRTIGYWFMGACVVAVVLLVTWLLPMMLQQQLGPIQTQLAILNARSALQSRDPAKAVGNLIEDSSSRIGQPGVDSRLDLETIAQLAKQADAAKLIVDPQPITASADTLVRVSMSGPFKDEAWRAVQAMMAYRSYLTAEDLPKGVPKPSLFSIDQFEGEGTLDKHVVEMGNTLRQIAHDHGFHFGEYGVSYPPDTAEIIRNSYPEIVLPPDVPGPEWLMLSGDPSKRADHKMGGAYIRNFIFKDLNIMYNGDPLVLDNVYFVNCSFQLARSDKSRALALAVLLGTAASFKN
jgi:hypothetical protein